MSIFNPADIRRYILEYCADLKSRSKIKEFLDIFLINTAFNDYKFRIIHSIVNRYLNLYLCYQKFGYDTNETIKLEKYKSFYKQFRIYRKLGYSPKKSIEESLLFNRSIHSLENFNFEILIKNRNLSLVSRVGKPRFYRLLYSSYGEHISKLLINLNFIADLMLYKALVAENKIKIHKQNEKLQS